MWACNLLNSIIRADTKHSTSSKSGEVSLWGFGTRHSRGRSAKLADILTEAPDHAMSEVWGSSVVPTVGLCYRARVQGFEGPAKLYAPVASTGSPANAADHSYG